MSELPEHWTPVNFGLIVDKLVNGGTPPTEVSRYWSGNTPWITGADFTPSGLGEFRRFVSNEAVRETSTNVISENKLLLVTRTGVGKLAIAPCDVAISQDITGVYPNVSLVDSLFLYHRMKAGVEELKKLNQGTSINGIIRGDLTAYPIKLPPLPQQRRIAEILSTVDDAIEATEALIAKQQQIKAGLMHDLFTRGVWTAESIAHAQQAGSTAAASAKPGQLRPCRETAPELYQESPLGWIPKDWEVKAFHRSNVEVIDGDRGSNYPNGDDFSSDGYCVFLSANNVTKSGFRFDRAQFISQAKHQLLRNGSLERKDIVITTRGTVGNIAYFDTSVSFDVMRINSGMVILRSREQGLHSEFLYASLQNFLFDREFKRVVSGSAQPQLPVRDLEKFHYFIPPQDEQLALVEKVSALDLKSDSERQVSQKLQKQKQGLMQDLLSGRVQI